MDEGTGIVHIAPGLRRRGLRAQHASTTCRCSRRSTSRAASTTSTAGCTACPRSRRPSRSSATSRSSDRLVEVGPVRAPLPRVLALPHAADLPHRRRLVHLGRATSASRCATPTATVEWVPEYMGKRMDDWLVNMGDWNISRRRYYGLPLPFYPCACGHLNVIGSKRELEERAVEGLDQLEELRRPWIDRVPIRCEECGDAVRADRRGRRRLARRRHRPVLDARLAERQVGRRAATRTGAAQGLTTRRPARPRLLGEVVPRRLGLGDARADPALVLLAALHVGRADRRRAVQARARLREDAGRERPRDARLVGEHDRRRRRVRAHGRRRDALAVLRAAAEPEPALRVRAGAGDQAQAADALELGAASSSTTRNVAGWTPRLDDLDGRARR